MNDRITAGAAALTGSLVLGTALVGWAVSPAPARVRHRAPRVRAVLDDASLEELLGPWPEKPFGAAFEQAWQYCQTCGKDTSGVVNKDGWLCGECVPAVSGGAS